MPVHVLYLEKSSRYNSNVRSQQMYDENTKWERGSNRGFDFSSRQRPTGQLQDCIKKNIPRYPYESDNDSSRMGLLYQPMRISPKLRS